jgi:hypothetical protein
MDNFTENQTGLQLKYRDHRPLSPILLLEIQISDLIHSL